MSGKQNFVTRFVKKKKQVTLLFWGILIIIIDPDFLVPGFRSNIIVKVNLSFLSIDFINAFGLR